MKEKDITPKCYNTFSCVGAILIIAFILGTLIWQVLFVCPQLQQTMEDLRSDMKELKTLVVEQCVSNIETVSPDSCVMLNNDTIK